MHSGYERLLKKARTSHAEGRCARQIDRHDIDLARLYCYAYRNHTIGAFHATGQAIQALDAGQGLVKAQLLRATETLEDLANQGMEAVPDDFRVVVATFHRYDRGVRRVLDALDAAQRASGSSRLDQIGQRFGELMGRISASDGIDPTRDTEAPEQASFIVPNLGITIVPLVYGDHHSWNLAFLSPEHLDVPWHCHHEGVEIHLGYSPLAGYMVLDRYKALVEEGYSLPIAPMTRHGWANTTGQVHHVPFIFGSLKQAGWGVFLDVEPQPMPFDELTTVDRAGWQMGPAAYLERQIRSLARLQSSRRQVVIPASVTDRNGSGGLELCLWRVTRAGLTLPVDDFRAVSVVSGQGTLQLASAQRHVEPHDHFGVPARMEAAIQQSGPEPLVLLEATIRGNKKIAEC